MLWKAGEGALHILASTHLAKRQLQFSATTRQVLDRAQLLILETDISTPPDPSIFASLDGQTAPWLDYLNGFNALAMAHGFKPEFGTEATVTRYKTWNQPHQYLETIRASLTPIIECPEPEIRTLLEQLKHSPSDVVAELEMLVDAVENGHADVIERYLQSTSMRTPMLDEGLLAERNRSWVLPLSRLARRTDPAVAVIGGLHTVGPDNILGLLYGVGLPVTRLD